MSARAVRLFEDALLPTNSTEETRKLYVELLKEEAKLKELDLAERKLELAEEQVRLQKARLRLQARQKGKTIQVESMKVVEGAEVARGLGPAKEVKAIEAAGEKAIEVNKRLAGVVARLEEIVNRGGWTDEKVLEARAVLAEAGKC